MQLYPILLVAVVLAADSGLRLFGSETMSRADALIAALFACGAPLMILLGTWLGVATCRRRLDRTGATHLILLAERLVRSARWLMLGAHAAAVLALGWLAALRSVTGDLILVDELLAILPPAVGVVGTYWVIHPIERRMREALLVRRLDEGKPVHQMPGRWRFVWAQSRVGLLMVLVPILLIVAIAETIRLLAVRWTDWEPTSGIVETATLAGAVVVFVCAPVLARFILSVRSMPEGVLREELLAICRRHDVRVRDILYWDTSGSMINAAVMGLIGRLRYVLVTDALLETMDIEQLRAVMAHEVGHVRRHHMIWLVLVLFAVIIAAAFLVELPLYALAVLGFLPGGVMGEWIVLTVAGMQLVLALLAFGWISRRFERQADTFAAQHLSGVGYEPARSGAPIEPAAVGAMQRALETIAELNAIDPNRRSWRHGSIRWRQMYLASIIGKPSTSLPIDRQVRWIKFAAGAVLLTALTGWGVLMAIGLA